MEKKFKMMIAKMNATMAKAMFMLMAVVMMASCNTIKQGSTDMPATHIENVSGGYFRSVHDQIINPVRVDLYTIQGEVYAKLPKEKQYYPVIALRTGRVFKPEDKYWNYYFEAHDRVYYIHRKGDVAPKK